MRSGFQVTQTHIHTYRQMASRNTSLIEMSEIIIAVFILPSVNVMGLFLDVSVSGRMESWTWTRHGMIMV